MHIVPYLIVAVISYMIGNIQCAVLLSKWKYKDDVRNHGSGNAGSTNMVRVFGLKSGLITFVGDFLKGILAVLLGRWIAGEFGGYIGALFVILGHDFPVVLRFRGGKGVATTFAIAWMLHPFFGLLLTIVAVIMFLLSKTISIVSLVSSTFYFLLILLFEWVNTPLVVSIAVFWTLIFVRHAENIKRIFNGTETRLTAKSN